MVANVGVIIGPIIGGVTSDLAGNYPNIFGGIGIITFSRIYSISSNPSIRRSQIPSLHLKLGLCSPSFFLTKYAFLKEAKGCFGSVRLLGYLFGSELWNREVFTILTTV